MPGAPPGVQPGVKGGRWPVAALAAGVAAVGAGYLSAFLPGPTPVWGPLLVVAGTGVSLAAGMALGVTDERRLARLLPVFGFVVLVVVGGLGALLLLPPASPSDPTLVLGLPPRAALLLYGIGLFPVLVVPLAYAWSFEEAEAEPAEAGTGGGSSDGGGVKGAPGAGPGPSSPAGGDALE